MFITLCMHQGVGNGGEDAYHTMHTPGCPQWRRGCLSHYAHTRVSAMEVRMLITLCMHQGVRNGGEDVYHTVHAPGCRQWR